MEKKKKLDIRRSDLYTSAIKSHAPGAGKLVFLESAAINGLLGEDITAAEQDLLMMSV